MLIKRMTNKKNTDLNIKRRRNSETDPCLNVTNQQPHKNHLVLLSQSIFGSSSLYFILIFFNRLNIRIKYVFHFFITLIFIVTQVLLKQGIQLN